MWHSDSRFLMSIVLVVCASVWMQTPASAQAPTDIAQGEAHATDPCDQVPGPPGRARGIHEMCPPPGSSSGIARGDFNGDGFADLAVGIPDKDFDEARPNAGAVAIVYGSPDGLTDSGTTVPPAQLWFLSSLGVAGQPSRSGDRFGAALAAGDFNGDQISDLAIGIPSRRLIIGGILGQEEHLESGAVAVIFGSANGLTASGTTAPRPQYIDLVGVGLTGDFNCLICRCMPYAGAHFGMSLAWGNFNGDAVGDLAIGLPDASERGCGPDIFTVVAKVGAVVVLLGSPPNGLNLPADRRGFLRTRASDNVLKSRDARFGASLTSGDFDLDGNSDLVVGEPGFTFGIFVNNSCSQNCAVAAGNIYVRSNLFGINPTEQFFSQQHANIPVTAGPWRTLQESAANEDRFGSSFAVGDFNGDAIEDLAIGAPFEKVGTRPSAGVVHVVYAARSGLTATGNQLWSQGTLEGSNEFGAQFGRALAAGDFNGDRRDDLAIGVPLKNVAGVLDAGQVNVIYGAPGGLSTTLVRAPQIWHQNSVGIQNLTPTILTNFTSVEGDRFGSSLTAWNFGHNVELGVPRTPTADLAIGIPFKKVTSRQGAGAVLVIYGCVICPGLTPSFAQVWTQRAPGIPGVEAADDHFGAALY